MQKTTEVGFLSNVDEALTFAKKVKDFPVRSADDFMHLEDQEKEIRKREKKLKLDYSEHPLIMKAKEMQETRIVVENAYKDARETSKMKRNAWAKIQELKRQSEERAAQEAARKKAEQEQLEAAIEAEKYGDKAAAEEIINEPVAVPVVVVPNTTPKVKNFRRWWYAEVMDETKIPEQFFKSVLDEKLLDDAAKAEGRGQERTGEIIPGVKFYYEER